MDFNSIQIPVISNKVVKDEEIFLTKLFPSISSAVLAIVITYCDSGPRSSLGIKVILDGVFQLKVPVTEGEIEKAASVKVWLISCEKVIVIVVLTGTYSAPLSGSTETTSGPGTLSTATVVSLSIFLTPSES